MGMTGWSEVSLRMMRSSITSATVDGGMMMTNQDVINFLNQVRKMLLDDKSWLESTIQPINEAFDMAISALKKQTLPSEQPRQTDCGYCHEDFDGYVRPIEKNLHAWLVRRGRTMKLRVCFKGGYSDCDILFCPMCGRRLTDG